MLSFEISAIDIVLLVVTLVLLSLYVTKSKETPKSQSKHRVENESRLKQTQKEKSSQKAKPSVKQAETNFPCPHQFGFLKQLPRNTPVPDECFGCPKVMQCLFPSE